MEDHVHSNYYREVVFLPGGIEIYYDLRCDCGYIIRDALASNKPTAEWELRGK